MWFASVVLLKVWEVHAHTAIPGLAFLVAPVVLLTKVRFSSVGVSMWLEVDGCASRVLEVCDQQKHS